MESYLMAIDAGTGSVRAVLFNYNGEQVACCQEEWIHDEDPRYPGSMNFNWEHNWDLTCRCTRGVLKEAGIESKQVSAIATTCMREGIVLYDGDAREIWACANVDARSDDEVLQLKKDYPNLEAELYAETGQLYALDALPRLLWVKNKMPDVYKKTEMITMFNDWLIYKLTGVFCSEPSNASTSGLLNLKTRNFDPDIPERCGLKTNIFAPIKECGEPAGTVSKKGEENSGLAEGTPVIVGGGDAQLGSIGVGVIGDNQAAVFGGSFWQYEYNTGVCTVDRNCRIRVNCHAVPGMWQYEALAFKPGLIMRWYRDAFCDHEKSLEKSTGKSVYAQMDEKASKIPAGSGGMFCAFSDIMDFMHWKHAAPTFTNFQTDADKWNRFTFYRAILENTAMVTRGHMELVKEATGNMPREVIFAGGASKSGLWCSILADVLGVPVKVPVVKEATALGAALLAGKGIGVYKDLSETASRLVKIEKTFTPDSGNTKVYDELYPVWKQVYKAQLELAEKGLTRCLWKAPGV